MIEIASPPLSFKAPNSNFPLPRAGGSQAAPDYATSLLSFGRRAKSMMPYSLIAAYSELTGWTDKQIGNMINMPRSTVQATRTGVMPESLTIAQREMLLKGAQAYRQEVYETVAKMELHS